MFETYTLTELIGKVQAYLDDDGTLYSDELVTAAIRSALNWLNNRAPMYDSITLSTETGQTHYTLDDFEGKDITVMQVTYTDIYRDREAVRFLFHRVNGTTPAIALYSDPGTHSDHLTLHYSEPHTIDGLDDGSTTTLPDWLGNILIIAAAAQAILQRTGSRIEANNLDQNTASSLMTFSHDLGQSAEKLVEPYACEPAPAARVRQSTWELDDWAVT